MAWSQLWSELEPRPEESAQTSLCSTRRPVTKVRARKGLSSRSMIPWQKSSAGSYWGSSNSRIMPIISHNQTSRFRRAAWTKLLNKIRYRAASSRHRISKMITVCTNSAYAPRTKLSTFKVKPSNCSWHRTMWPRLHRLKMVWIQKGILTRITMISSILGHIADKNKT